MLSHEKENSESDTETVNEATKTVKVRKFCLFFNILSNPKNMIVLKDDYLSITLFSILTKIILKKSKYKAARSNKSSHEFDKTQIIQILNSNSSQQFSYNDLNLNNAGNVSLLSSPIKSNVFKIAFEINYYLG